jgi:integrase
MDVKAARQAARVVSGEIAGGKITPGRRDAVKFGDALTSYIEFLKSQSSRKGKSATWAANVESLARKWLRPEWEKFTLAEMSARPDLVAAWHKKISKKTPVTANKCAKVISATYKRAARANRTLPPHNPCSAVEYNTEVRSQKAMVFADFPKWREAWEQIDNPVRKAFQMINLLCGARCGELSKLEWTDVLPRERVIVIRAAKAGNEIRIPMSAAIARELKRTRDAQRGTARDALQDSEWVFPARAGGHIVKFDADRLPAHGMMLRRVWRTVALDCGVEELLSHFMLGHAVTGISRGYVAKMILASGPAMRAAQSKVSRRIVSFLAAAGNVGAF